MAHELPHEEQPLRRIPTPSGKYRLGVVIQPRSLTGSSRPKADMGMAAAPSQRPMTSANTLPNLAMAALLSTIGAVV